MHGRNARTVGDDAGKIERIGRGNQRPFIRRLAVAEVAEAGDHGFNSELLATHSANETSAADFAAELHTSQRASQFPPGRRRRLTGKEISEENAVASQEQLAPHIEL